MADLNSLSNWVQILGGVAGGVATVASGYYRWVILPARKKAAEEATFKTNVLQAIGTLETNATKNKEYFEESIKDLTKALQDSDAYEQKEIEEIKQDLKDMARDMNDHISRVDNKNELYR